MVVLAGAYVMNAGYALILLIKNKSFGSFKTPDMFSRAEMGDHRRPALVRGVGNLWPGSGLDG